MPEDFRSLRVFLSYAKEDYGVVHEVYSRLSNEGWIDPWLDKQKLLPGEHWTATIKRAIDIADAVIIFLSENSIYKEGFVYYEMNYAWERSLQKPPGTIYRIPIRLDNCDIPEDLYDLNSRQWDDYFDEKKEETYKRLLKALQYRLEQKERFELRERARADLLAKREANKQEYEERKQPGKRIAIEELEKQTEQQYRKQMDESEEQQAAEQPVNEAEKLKSVIEAKIEFEPQINWQLPVVENILDKGHIPEVNEEFIHSCARLIEETLSSFDAPAQVVEINRGPSITQYGVEPLFVKAKSGRVKVRAAKIESLADEIAFALAVRNVRIQVPVPGRSYIGIEVPNQKLTPIALRNIIESKLFQQETGPLKFALGCDVMGKPIIATLEKVPNLLIAGSGRSGKSVCVDSLLACLLLCSTPNDLRLMLIDPKRVELTIYNGIPHLIAPVIVEIERASGALQWVAREMDKRYQIFAQFGARNITDYNARMIASSGKKLPSLVMVVSEFTDLMMAAPAETEQIITRLAKLARNTGIYMILITQRPSGDVLTRLIKANFPARITFAVASNSESRVILDQAGAERLLGRGDMLFQAPGVLAPMRLQGAFIADHEIQNLLEFWNSQSEQDNRVPEITDLAEKIEPTTDPLLPDAIELVRREGRASTSMLQRHMRIGYTRAARIVDIMEDRGIVSPAEGASRIRKILDYGTVLPPKDV